MKLFIAALAPVTAILLVFYQIDRFDREPVKLLAKLFGVGVLIAIPVMIVENLLSALNFFAYTTLDLANVYTAFIVAGFTEETFKWLGLKYLAYRNKAFDEALDGIVYAVHVSLGFAALENLCYVLGIGDIGVAMTRALTSVPGHMLFAVAMGYYISIMKFAKTKSVFLKARRKSLLIPIIIHGIYDYILMSHFKWLLIFFIPYIIWMWVFGIKRVRMYYIQSKEAHAEA